MLEGSFNSTLAVFSEFHIKKIDIMKLGEIDNHELDKGVSEYKFKKTPYNLEKIFELNNLLDNFLFHQSQFNECAVICIAELDKLVDANLVLSRVSESRPRLS